MKKIYIVTIQDTVSEPGTVPKKEEIFFQDEILANYYVEGFEAAKNNFKKIIIREEYFYDGQN